jgi:hypothetical protein
MIVKTKLFFHREILPDMTRLFLNLPPAKEGDYLQRPTIEGSEKDNHHGSKRISERL